MLAERLQPSLKRAPRMKAKAKSLGIPIGEGFVDRRR
jgi:hypothetical protein